MINKKETIAETMRQFMATAPSITNYPNYKSLNDAVGAVHGLEPGKVQALAGEKAWAWTADATTGTWRKATEAEIEAKRQAAAGKAHGGPRSKVLSDADRATLDSQIAALKAVANPALAPLLEGLLARQGADDQARKGSLKDRLAAAIDRLGLEEVVKILEARITAAATEATAPEA